MLLKPNLLDKREIKTQLFKLKVSLEMTRDQSEEK